MLVLHQYKADCMFLSIAHLLLLTQIYNRLNGQFSKQQVDQALQQLTSDAHVYTTTDDDHYKAA